MLVIVFIGVTLVSPGWWAGWAERGPARRETSDRPVGLREIHTNITGRLHPDFSFSRRIGHCADISRWFDAGALREGAALLRIGGERRV